MLEPPRHVKAMSNVGVGPPFPLIEKKIVQSFFKYTVIYEMILLQCLIYHRTSTIAIIFSINQSMLFPIKTISQNYEHCIEW
jgi:hypothetical protein